MDSVVMIWRDSLLAPYRGAEWVGHDSRFVLILAPTVLWDRERYVFLKQSEIRDRFRKAAARSECRIDALGSSLMT
jgi:hypothetical protein